MGQKLKYSLLIAGISGLFFTLFLGGVHLFDWDEINFAEISREMLLTRDYTRVYINFQPFWEKPPLFFWLQALAMAGMGVGEFAARFPNAVCGAVTLVVIYRIGRQFFSHRFGLLWAGAYFGSVLPFLYFKSGIIDPWFNLFIFLGLYHFLQFHWKKNGYEGIPLRKSYWTYLFWAGFFTGMGILTKGQVAYLIVCLTLGVYWIYQRFRFYVNIPQFLFFTLAATLVTLIWYGTETLKNGTWFIEAFNRYQYRLFSTHDAGHKGFPGYHFAVLLVGCFPASIFAIRAFFAQPAEETDQQNDFRRWMKFLFWVVLILFSIVQSKIVHYSSMCYFPLTFLAALVMDKITGNKLALSRWMKFGLWMIGGVYMAATIILPFAARNAERWKFLIKDPFGKANLDAAVHWTGWEAAAGFLLLAAVLVFFRYARKNNWRTAWPALFGGTAVFIMLTLAGFIGRIEGYSQRAAIEFFTAKADEDCYIITKGYKSYAHLFYARKRPVSDARSYDENWLFTGKTDKPVYVVTKINKTAELEKMPGLKEIGRKNGFVFYQRID